MEEILVPTDFTGISDIASSTAIKLAKKGDFKIIYLHLIAVDAEKVAGIEKERFGFQKDLIKEVGKMSKKLDVYVDLAKDQHVKAERLIKYDKSYQSLLDYIKNNNIYMVVMGSHGARGTKELLQGSNAQMVARFSPTPVLVVKEGYVHNNLENMAFLADFEQQPSLGYKRAISLAKKFSMNLHLAFINTPKNFTRNTELYKKMDPYFNNESIEIASRNSFNAFNLEDGIIEYAENFDIDIIAMVTHDRQGTSTITHSSMTEKLINHLRFPVLCLHN